MTMSKIATAVMTLCAMANPAFASGSCVTPADAMALKTAALQQQLMVAAFMCHDTKPYNHFVLAYRRELQGSDRALKMFFIHRASGHGEADYDTYKTRAANLSALAQARNDRAFCNRASHLFDAALEHRTTLAAFVATAPSAPGYTEICVDSSKEARTRAAVHMARAASTSGEESSANPVPPKY